MFSTLFNRPTTPASKTTPRHARPRLEGLEARDVPAVVAVQPLTPILRDGVLTVIGNSASNVITVTQTGNAIKVLGKQFSANAVSSIMIAGEGGHDRITVSESINRPTYLYGGAGSDTIKGGSGVDHIYGGSSGDTIFGRGGNDVIYGGTGFDTFDGGPGTDEVNDHESGEPATATNTSSSEDPEMTTYSSSSFSGKVVREVLRLINAARAAHGRAALSLDATLTSVAADFASELDRLNGRPGVGVNRRVAGTLKPVLSARLDSNFISYLKAGENDAATRISDGTAPETLAYRFMYGPNGRGGLMASAAQRANILGGAYFSVGLGLAGDVAGGYYLVQTFKG